jgi:hypothetical protein
MQDSVPGHAASATQEEFHERGIYPIFWPPFSPDLNPIEAVWNVMKDYVAKHFPEDIVVAWPLRERVVAGLARRIASRIRMQAAPILTLLLSLSWYLKWKSPNRIIFVHRPNRYDL